MIENSELAFDKSELEDLVSVIIPTVELNQYLILAIKSIINDGYPAIEIIVVFDGKLPTTGLFIDDKVAYYETGARAGAAAAINLGVKMSKGTYIARLDADDISLPGRFASQVAYFNNNENIVVVGSTAVLINDSGVEVGSFSVKRTIDIQHDLLRRNPFVHSSVMMLGSALEECGGYDESCIRMQDYELFLRMANVGRMTILADPLVQYRVHSSQSSKKLVGFIPLMLKISSRRRSLARRYGKSLLLQAFYDLVYSFAQYLRYLGLRKPRYLRGVDV